MPYLKKIDTGAVTDYLDSDSPEYQTLVKMRTQTATTISGSGGFGAGSGGSYTIPKGEPIWESIPVQDLGLPAGPVKRVIVIFCPGASAAATETSAMQHNPTVGGKLTEVAYVPLAAMGETTAETNYRLITLQQIVLGKEAATEVTRKIEKLAIVTFKKVANSGLLVPTLAKIEKEEFVTEEGLQVVSSLGAGEQVDPGGVLYATFTKV